MMPTPVTVFLRNQDFAPSLIPLFGTVEGDSLMVVGNTDYVTACYSVICKISRYLVEACNLIT